MDLMDEGEGRPVSFCRWRVGEPGGSVGGAEVLGWVGCSAGVGMVLVVDGCGAGWLVLSAGDRVERRCAGGRLMVLVLRVAAVRWRCQAE
jgi:hypothetical protein